MECRQKIVENKLGTDLKPLGRIQGPFEATNCFQNKREVVFIFDRCLSAREIWDNSKKNQMAQAAVDIGAVSDL